VSFDGPLRIWTARVTYLGALPTLDVSRGSGGELGLAFAPSRGLLDPTIARRKEIEAEERKLRRKKASVDKAARLAMIDQEATALWEIYEPRYRAEMRISSGLMTPRHRRWGELEQEAWERGVRPRPAAWWALRSEAAQEGLVLTCWCGPRWSDAGQCHRLVLGAILARLGAEYAGEAPAELQPAFVGAPRRRSGRKCFVVGRDDPAELSAHDRAEIERFTEQIRAAHTFGRSR
jgi:hypothetical protein